MRVKVLGSAAGGGFPQWNCACRNCRRLRSGRFPGTPRAGTQLAWQAASGSRWALLNASPDLPSQIEATAELWPQDGKRHSPISDVVLTGGEVDQALGLLLLREFHSFAVHATRSVRSILTEDNSLFGVLARFPGQVCWHDIPLERRFSVAGARLEALPLSGSFPGFVGAARRADCDPAEAVIGLWISPESRGQALAFVPCVASVSDSLLDRLKQCDVLLFDGTFWSNDEPASIPGLGRTALEMGHLPISGPGGSLERLAAVDCRRIFIHLNNTNPILDEESAERRRAHEAGWEVAWDGMEITL
jgi:pyrroloquinoline quinone biosynthesis protein B